MPDTVTGSVNPDASAGNGDGTAVPRTPEFGETAVTAGGAIVNVTALLVPPGVRHGYVSGSVCASETDLERCGDGSGVDYRDVADRDAQGAAETGHVDR